MKAATLPEQPDAKSPAGAGGPTWTHSLNLSSPAVGHIPAGVNGCVPGIRDQRGELRFPPCNIGAFEADRVEHVYLPMIVKH